MKPEERVIQRLFALNDKLKCEGGALLTGWHPIKARKLLSMAAALQKAIDIVEEEFKIK